MSPPNSPNSLARYINDRKGFIKISMNFLNENRRNFMYSLDQRQEEYLRQQTLHQSMIAKWRQEIKASQSLSHLRSIRNREPTLWAWALTAAIIYLLFLVFTKESEPFRYFMGSVMFFVFSIGHWFRALILNLIL